MFKINNEFKNANVSRTIRFPEELFIKLKDVSTKNNISLNLLILQCCIYAIKNIPKDNLK
ncbi:MAG: hypothetical protein R3Y29_04045 [bacterium]